MEHYKITAMSIDDLEDLIDNQEEAIRQLNDKVEELKGQIKEQ